jgi:hypothetical protein
VSTALLADAVLVVHLAFVLFVVGGLALVLAGARRGWAWIRNPWFRWTHLGAIVFVALEALAGIACPLTVWEDALRGATGRPSFVARGVRAVLYWDLPMWIFTAAYVLFAAAVAYALIAIPPRRREKHKSLTSSDSSGGDPV